MVLAGRVETGSWARIIAVLDSRIHAIAASARKLSPLDRLIAEADTALRTIAAQNTAMQPKPGMAQAPGELSAGERAASARLMRVNHSGEIAAQALYRGQALFARDSAQRAALLQAATEEGDHLAWCHQRTTELGGATSRLAPVWYLGSLAIGAAAALAGDKISLGFLAETERQVAEHLAEHLDRLPAADEASRAILEQMRSDEIRHGSQAQAQGAAELPDPVKSAMRGIARIMTTLAYRI